MDPDWVRDLKESDLCWRTWTALEFKGIVNFGYIPCGHISTLGAITRRCWYYYNDHYAGNTGDVGVISDLVDGAAALLEVTNLTQAAPGEFPKPIVHSVQLLWFPRAADAAWIRLQADSLTFHPLQFTIDNQGLLCYNDREE